MAQPRSQCPKTKVERPWISGLCFGRKRLEGPSDSGRKTKSPAESRSLAELDYPEAEATVPIHPETPTSGHNYLCIPLAKSAIGVKLLNLCNLVVTCNISPKCSSSIFRRSDRAGFQILYGRMEIRASGREISLFDTPCVIARSMGNMKSSSRRKIGGGRIHFYLDATIFLTRLLRWVVGNQILGAQFFADLAEGPIQLIDGGRIVVLTSGVGRHLDQRMFTAKVPTGIGFDRNHDDCVKNGL